MDVNQLQGFIEQAQALAQKLQGDLGQRTATGAAGGGLVEATVNGLNQLVSLRIDPKAIDPKEPALLEDLVRAAVNQAFDRLKETVAGEMQRAVAGQGR